MDRMLWLTVDYLKTRVQFGKPIGGFQLTQEKLAWMYVGLGQSQLTALHLGRLHQRVRRQQVLWLRLRSLSNSVSLSVISS